MRRGVWEVFTCRLRAFTHLCADPQHGRNIPTVILGVVADTVGTETLSSMPHGAIRSALLAAHPCRRSAEGCHHPPAHPVTFQHARKTRAIRKQGTIHFVAAVVTLHGSIRCAGCICSDISVRERSPFLGRCVAIGCGAISRAAGAPWPAARSIAPGLHPRHAPTDPDAPVQPARPALPEPQAQRS